MEKQVCEYKKDRIYHLLRERLVSNFYKPGERLPNDRSFAKEFKVSLVTLRPILKRLSEEGLLIRVLRQGTFVPPERKANTVLVVIPQNNNIENPTQYILPGIETTLPLYGLNIEIAYLEDFRKLDMKTCIEKIKQIKPYGIILFASSIMPDDPELIWAKGANVPVVIVSNRKNDNRYNLAKIGVNTKEAWISGFKYLVNKGYKKIKILTLKTDSRDWSEKELAQIYRKMGLQNPNDFFYKAIFTQESIESAIDLMIQNGIPDAIYCYSDFYASIAMNYLQKKYKKQIPEQIAIMGYCGYPGRIFLSPSLSTVDTHYKLQGQKAVKILTTAETWFQKPGIKPPIITVPFTVDEKESTSLKIVKK